MNFDASAIALVDDAGADATRQMLPGGFLAPERPQDRLRRELRERLEREAEKKRQRAVKPRRAPAPEFTTDAAISWGKAQGWTVVQRERWGATHVKGQVVYRREDCSVGSDVIFATPGGLVLVQAAGRNQRADHYRKFLNRGGTRACKELGARFIYVEFDRESVEPVLKEEWA